MTISPLRVRELREVLPLAPSAYDTVLRGILLNGQRRQDEDQLTKCEVLLLALYAWMDKWMPFDELQRLMVLQTMKADLEQAIDRLDTAINQGSEPTRFFVGFADGERIVWDSDHGPVHYTLAAGITEPHGPRLFSTTLDMNALYFQTLDAVLHNLRDKDASSRTAPAAQTADTASR